MPTCAEVCAELRGVRELVAQQTTAGLDRNETIDALFASKLIQIQSMGCIPDTDKADILRAFATGPWEFKHSAELADAMRANGVTTADKKVQRRPNQHAPQFENMITEKLWIDLSNTAKFSAASRCHMLARLAAMLGIENPSPKLLYRLVQILAYAASDFAMSQDDVFKNMDMIQDFIKGYKQAKGTPYLHMFPLDAAELDEVLLKRAYPDGELPVHVTIPELDSILKGAKMRGRGKDTEWLNSVPSEYQDILLTDHPELTRRRKGKLPPHVFGRGPASRPPPSLGTAPASGHVASDLLSRGRVPLQLPAPPTRASVPGSFGLLSTHAHKREHAEVGVKSEYLADGHVHACRVCGYVATEGVAIAESLGMARGAERVDAARGGAAKLEHAHPSTDAAKAELRPPPAAPMPSAAAAGACAHPRGSVEEMEDKLAEAFTDRAAAKARAPKPAAMKRPAAYVGKAVKHAKIAKKPAGVLKLLAGPALDAKGFPIMTDVFDKMKEDVASISYNAFNSRAYDSATRRGRKAGLTEAVLKTWRETQTEKANLLYARLTGK